MDTAQPINEVRISNGRFPSGSMSSRFRRCLGLALALLTIGLTAPAAEAIGPPQGDGEFYYPRTIAADPLGNVYVVDGLPGYGRVQKLTSDGVFIEKWGQEGKNEGQLGYVDDIATDAAGNVYVTSTYSTSWVGAYNRVLKFSSDGTPIASWGTDGIGDGQFTAPNGIAADPSGNVHVVDSWSQRIQKFTPTGNFLLQWGTWGVAGTGDGQFDDPWGIAIDPAGSVYVTDRDNRRVQKFTTDGEFVTKWGTQGEGDGQFNWPESIAADAAGNVYVADIGSDRVQKFTSAGGFVADLGARGSGDGQLDDPADVATDPAGNVYVADMGNSRVQKFASDGTFVAKWPTPAPAPPASQPNPITSAPPPAKLIRPTINSGPRRKTRARTASLRFKTAQQDAQLQCRLTGKRVPKALKRWSTCTSPKRYAKLTTGTKAFLVRVVRDEEAGPAATRSWRIVSARKTHPKPRK